MVRSYMECLEWCGCTDEKSGNPFDARDSVFWSWGALRVALRDCKDFMAVADSEYPAWRGWWTPGALGRDFYLTRNHHGAGFWDRYGSHSPTGYELGRELTELAHPYGECVGWVDARGLLWL
jgi:hypothetical protein